jgi:predicted SnoaL-like aldol condensation-catalyzing enzyme
MTANLEGLMRSLVLAGCVMAAALSTARAADVEANKELYRHYIEDLWNKKDPAAPDRYLAPDFVEHNTNLPPGLDGRNGSSPSCLRHFLITMPRFSRWSPKCDRVVARVQFTGTNDGPYDGRPPTHNKLSFSTADFFRIANGKIAEHWDVVNVLPRMIALGQIQPPAPAPKPPEDETAKPR